MIVGGIDIVSEIAPVRIPEHLLEIRLCGVAHRLHLPYEFTIGVSPLALHIDGEAEGVVPPGIGIHLVARPFGDRISVYICIHPAEGDVVHLGPEQAVRMEADFVAASRQVTFDDALDGLPVFLPYPLLEAREVYVLLQGVDEAERGLYLGGPAEEPLLIVGDESVEYFLEFRAITGGVKGKSRKGGDGLAEQARI